MIYIGEILKERMDMLSIDEEVLADRAFLEVSDVHKMLNDEICLENIDSHDLGLLSSVLHCKPAYFSDASYRKQDLLTGAQNRGADDDRSKQVKLSIQDYISDFSFLKSII